MADLLTVGTRDRYKGGVHLCVFGVVVAMGLYGLGQWLEGGRPRHALNMLVYLGLVAPFEAVQVWRHWGQQ